ncbi:MAG: 5-formyltetrahydrofolate cyclo-ligase [Planctomycetes bacterium]|nr:5-formyltetrahydrofolate cyclo-ligase [Planctomycetota bacterium]
MNDEQSNNKADVRGQVKAKLAAMTSQQQHDASVAACKRLIELNPFQDASIVMLYMPMANEVDLTPVAIRCFQAGKTVCVPRVDWRRKDMDAVEVQSFDDHIMELDEHGLRTPRDGAPMPSNLIDLVVVPGLAFDAHGHRLGRGGGYYDRFLSKLRRSATSIGLAFEEQMIDQVPINQDDVSVNIVVTDRRVTNAPRSRTVR